jgi:hypothetical protein
MHASRIFYLGHQGKSCGIDASGHNGMLEEETNGPYKVCPDNTPAFLVEQGCEAIRT